MKSVSLLSYTLSRSGDVDTLTEIARHYDTLWGTAVGKVADNTYLAADAEGNLTVLQQNTTSHFADDRKRLNVISEMLLGEMVNRIRPIAVTPTANAVVIPRAFCATVEGGVYLFGLIAQDKQNLLMNLQDRVAEVIESPGGVPFKKFRGFRSQVRDEGESGPNRFVDGEVLERYLDLPEDVQEKIVEGLIGAEECRGIVEALRRMH
jgi:DNA damage-binding protein 1